MYKSGGWGVVLLYPVWMGFPLLIKNKWMSFICSLKTWRPQHPAFIDDCCQSWIFLVGNFFLIYMYSTCSYLALVGSNYLVGWNDCTKSKLMKKSTTWYYCTHTCNADMTQSDRILRTYNPSNVTMPKESTWYNI